jgi:hypothetical protein
VKTKYFPVFHKILTKIFWGGAVLRFELGALNLLGRHLGYIIYPPKILPNRPQRKISK